MQFETGHFLFIILIKAKIKEKSHSDRVVIMNVFKQFYRSLYSPKDIATFRFQGIGKTILFVFLLSLLSILPSVFFISTSIINGIDSARAIINDDLPSFSIKNGQLTAKTSVPVTINKDHFTVILDPTGAVTTKELEGTDNTFAILKNEFVFAAGGQTESYAYSMINGMDFTSRDLLHFIDLVNGVKAIIIPIISFVLYLFTCAANFIEISILALIGLLLKNLVGRKLTYGHLWRMATYSETLPTLFFTIMAAIKTTVPMSFLINWLVVIIILYAAINETPKPKTKT